MFSYPTVHTQQSSVPNGVAEHNVTVARAFTKLMGAFVTLSVEGVFQMAYIVPERLLTLVRPAFDLPRGPTARSTWPSSA